MSGEAQARRHGSSSPPTTRARCASSPSCSRRSASRCVSAAELGLPEPEETGDELRRECHAQGGGRGDEPPGCSRSPTIQGSRSRHLAARPASIRRAGADLTRTSASPWRACNRELEAAGADDRQRQFHLRAGARRARRRRRRCSRARCSGRSSGRRAGRAVSAMIRSSCRTAIRETFGEMDPGLKNECRTACAPSRTSSMAVR